MSADLFSVLCFSSSSTDYHRNQLMNHTDERCEIWRFVNPQLTWPAICSDHTCVHHRSCSFLDISITLHHAFQAINFKWCVCFIFRPPGAIGFTDNRKGNINRQKNFKNSNQKVWLNSVCVFFHDPGYCLYVCGNFTWKLSNCLHSSPSLQLPISLCVGLWDRPLFLVRILICHTKIQQYTFIQALDVPFFRMFSQRNAYLLDEIQM